MAELATALKAKFGEEREDKFSEASKVVKHPEIIHPTQKAGLASDLQELVDLRPARVSHSTVGFCGYAIRAA